jgi:hypothetical protein
MKEITIMPDGAWRIILGQPIQDCPECHGTGGDRHGLHCRCRKYLGSVEIPVTPMTIIIDA